MGSDPSGQRGNYSRFEGWEIIPKNDMPDQDAGHEFSHEALLGPTFAEEIGSWSTAHVDMPVIHKTRTFMGTSTTFPSSTQVMDELFPTSEYGVYPIRDNATARLSGSGRGTRQATFTKASSAATGMHQTISKDRTADEAASQAAALAEFWQRERARKAQPLFQAQRSQRPGFSPAGRQVPQNMSSLAASSFAAEDALEHPLQDDDMMSFQGGLEAQEESGSLDGEFVGTQNLWRDPLEPPDIGYGTPVWPSDAHDDERQSQVQGDADSRFSNISRQAKEVQMEPVLQADGLFSAVSVDSVLETDEDFCASPEAMATWDGRTDHAPLFRVHCPRCTEYPKGFRNDHELRRHIHAKHEGIVKKYVCRDPATVGIESNVKAINPLSKCRACVSGKEYGAYYNAAAHLRRNHFKPKVSRVKRRVDAGEVPVLRGGGDWPPMIELKNWLVEKSVRVDPSDAEQDSVDADMDTEMDIDTSQSIPNSPQTRSMAPDITSHNRMRRGDGIRKTPRLGMRRGTVSNNSGVPYTVSQDHTSGEQARQSDLLADFGREKNHGVGGRKTQAFHPSISSSRARQGHPARRPWPH